MAVIGDNIRETLFGGVNPIGKSIKVNGQNFTVVGVVQRRGGGGFRSPDDQVTIPVTTVMRRVFGVNHLSSISVQAVSPEGMGRAQREVERVIAKEHQQRPDAEPDVRIMSQAEIAESAATQSGFLTMLLSGIALVSLIVGGIGIMNIMVTVTERTREIGLRKSIGAKRSDVLYKFLIESIALSILGGLVGIAAGVGLSLWMSRPADAGGMGMAVFLTPEPAGRNAKGRKGEVREIRTEREPSGLSQRRQGRDGTAPGLVRGILAGAMGRSQ